MKRLYLIAALAQIVEMIAWVIYLPSMLISRIADWLYGLSGCADEVEKDEDEFLEELNNEEEKEEDYE